MYSLARNQFAMGRRFFRFFRFLGQFARAGEVLRGVDGGSGVLTLAGVGKFSFMGAYLGLESLSVVSIVLLFSSSFFF